LDQLLDVLGAEDLDGRGQLERLGGEQLTDIERQTDMQRALEAVRQQPVRSLAVAAAELVGRQDHAPERVAGQGGPAGHQPVNVTSPSASISSSPSGVHHIARYRAPPSYPTARQSAEGSGSGRSVSVPVLGARATGSSVAHRAPGDLALDPCLACPALAGEQLQPAVQAPDRPCRATLAQRRGQHRERDGVALLAQRREDQLLGPVLTAFAGPDCISDPIGALRFADRA
jgi:hypothetical protein